ncbi:hypothetical protein FACS189421_01590 [Bacteroidia bacterium]|nr:hypothetical protein FACS189421_01590 [Bacteroidia bacterium]GHT49800.1 hypothetical protein FACS189440_16130 [Bacteroidia bacterium]
MKKNTIFYLSIGFILFLSSCVRTEENLFDESAAIRINHAVSDSKELLLSATNGWVMEYFPTNEQTGVTFLVKFDANGMATIATKNEYVTAYREDVGEWEVIPESGPVLTFNTYIPIFHLYSDPSSGLGKGLGLGLEGDYEFIVMNSTNDLIQLKGKKRGTDIILHRLAENQNWKDYFTILEDMETLLFNKNVPALTLLVNDSTYILKEGTSHIFKLTSESDVYEENIEELPFIITEKGLRLAKPYKSGEVEVQTFKLSDDKNNLICTDEGVDAKIVGPKDLLNFYTESIDQRGLRWTLSTVENGLSPLVKAAYDRVVQAFEAKKITLGQVSYTYSGRNSTHVVYLADNKGANAGNIFFNREISAEKINYIFTDKFDNNGRTFYNSYDGVSDLVGFLSGSFKIDYASSQLNPTLVKFTSVSNPDIWFRLDLK